MIFNVLGMNFKKSDEVRDLTLRCSLSRKDTWKGDLRLGLLFIFLADYEKDCAASKALGMAQGARHSAGPFRVTTREST